MSLFRNPAETDPLLTQSERNDFPPDLERQVVDGGVAEGRPESHYSNDLIWVFVIVFGIMITVGLLLNWSRFFP